MASSLVRRPTASSPSRTVSSRVSRRRLTASRSSRYGQQPYGQPQQPYGQQPYGQPQPYGAPGGYGGGKPSNYLGWAIGCIFLFWPVAIPAIINATKVDPAWQYGNQPEAQLRSEKAKMFCMIATGVGALLWIVNIIIFATL